MDCNECYLMERELKRAAALVKRTKEKISFGLMKVGSADDVSAEIQITKFPTLIAIK